MRKMKRNLSLFLTFAMLLSMCVTTSYALESPSVSITTSTVAGYSGVYEMDVNVISNTNMKQFEVMLSFNNNILALAAPADSYNAVTVNNGDNSAGNLYLANAVQGAVKQLGSDYYTVATAAYIQNSRTAVYATLTHATGETFADSTTVMRIYFTLINGATEASLTKSSIIIETDASAGAFLSQALAVSDRYGIRLINGDGTFQYEAVNNPLTATLEFPGSTIVDNYTGQQATIPSIAAKKGGSVTLASQSVPGESVEYACGTSAAAPDSGWQDSVAFTNLIAGESYYFFARVKESDLHKSGMAAGTSTAVLIYAVPLISYLEQKVNNYIDSISVSPTVSNSGSGDLTYSISPALPSGMDLNTSNGEIFGIPNAALVGTYTVTATDSETQIGTAEIVFSKGPAVVTSCGISGPDSITISGTEERQETYTATAYDQFGDAMDGQTVTWETAVPTATNAVFNTTNGVLTVPQNATPGTITLISSVSGISPAVTGNKTVTITSKAAQGLTFSDEGKTATYGDASFTVSAIHTEGNGTVTYASSNPGVATVDAATGMVNIIGEGSATITAVAAETETYAVATASYTLTVEPKEVSLTWNGDQNLIYDGSPKNVTAITGGLVGTDTCTVIVAEGSQTNAGIYTAVATTLSNSNYKLPSDNSHSYTIAPMPVSVIWGSDTLAYNGVAQAPTATAAGVGGVELSLSVTGGQTQAGTGYTAVAALTVPNSNYILTNTSKTFTIAAVTVAITTTEASVSKTILANDTSNSDAMALKAGMALPTTVSISSAGSTTSAVITWADASQVFNAKGNIYTYVGTLDANSNFANQPTITATLTVSPVTIQSIMGVPTALTMAKSEVMDAVSLTALSLPSQVALTFDQSVAGMNVSATWDKTIEDIQTTAGTVTESHNAISTATLTAACLPVWATYSGTMPNCTITITDKFPVTVSFTTPIKDIAYGGTLTIPEATAMDSGNGLAATSSWEYIYTGTTSAGEDYGPVETAPTDAGAYTVTATYVSNTHAGTAQDSFTIAKKEIGLSWSNNTDLTYDGTAKNVTASATDLKGTDLCAVTVAGGTETNAGSYAATATALSNPNYVLPAVCTQAYSIAKADRTLSINPVSTTLVPGNLTRSITANTMTDLDSSAVITYTSSNPSIVTVSNVGKITAVGNGVVTITVSIPATANYNAATESSCSVTAITVPVTGAVASGGTNDQLTATVYGTTITVNGFITAGATLSIAPTLAVGVTGDSTVTIADVTQEKLTTGLSYSATADAIAIPYTIVTSGVVLLPENVDVSDGVPQSTVSEEIPDQSAISSALNDTGTGTSGLAGVTAGTTTQRTAQRLTEMAQTLQDAFGTASDAYRAIVSTFVRINVTAYSAGNSLTMDITPYYVASANGGGHDPIELLAATRLENSQINGKILIKIAKGSMNLPTENLFAKHSIGTNLYEYLPVTFEGGVYSFETASFSEFELINDTRTVTINFQYEDGSIRTATYNASDLGTAFESLTKSGNTFNGWMIGQTTYTNLNDALLTAGGTVTATPSFTSATVNPGSTGGGGTATYQIKATAGTGGTITPASYTVNLKGSAVFAIKADNGYRISDVMVDGKSVGVVSTYTFSAVIAAHTISATFEKKSDVSDIFFDIDDVTWCHDAVQYVYDASLMNGVTSTSFAPEATLNRGMWVTMLYRLAGSPSVIGSSKFSDVTANTWCANAVIWAAQSGIINGFEDGTFRTGMPVTRQQLVTFLYRYAQYKGYAATNSAANLGDFTDAPQVWSADAVLWALGNGIMNGTTTTTLTPNGNSNRGQAATFLMRFMSNIAG